MKHAIHFTTTLFIITSTSFLSQVDAQNSTDRESILTQHQKFQTAVKNKDSITLSSLYTDSATSLRQNEPSRVGKTLIVDRWKRAFRIPFVLITKTERLEFTSGSSAYHYGNFEVQSTDTPPQILATGKWAMVWVKQGNEWKIALEMDSFNAAKPN